MEALNALLAGFGVALQPMNLMWGFIGVTLGTFVGVLPGVGPALATSAIGSFVAGTIATLLLTLLAPLVVDLALKFGPAEYFALMVFAFITVAAVLGNSTVRGLTSLFLGLFLGLIGIDSQTGQARFAFGVPELLDGVDVVVLAVGLFAVGEALYVAAYQSRLP